MRDAHCPSRAGRFAGTCSAPHASLSRPCARAPRKLFPIASCDAKRERARGNVGQVKNPASCAAQFTVESQSATRGKKHRAFHEAAMRCSLLSLDGQHASLDAVRGRAPAEPAGKPKEKDR
jgi:hypothetical protein